MNYSHLPMPTREAHYAFLKSHYLSARFEGRNNASWEKIIHAVLLRVSISN